MIGRCVEATNTTNLVVGETYYLFPHGGSAYYVSRFPRKGSHIGAYQKHYFELVDETENDTSEMVNETIEFEHGKVYKARLSNAPNEHYENGGTYYLTSTSGPYCNQADCYIYKDRMFRVFCGRFSISRFSDIEEIEMIVKKEVEVVELPRDQWEQIDLFSI